jgi:hypothetical protein
MTIQCVCRATLKDVVTWRKGNDVLMSNAALHITVDTFSILHMYDVTQANEGNYTCFVGNTPMQNYTVYIMPATKSRIEGKCVVLLEQCMCILNVVVSTTYLFQY